MHRAGDKFPPAGGGAIPALAQVYRYRRPIDRRDDLVLYAHYAPRPGQADRDRYYRAERRYATRQIVHPTKAATKARRRLVATALIQRNSSVRVSVASMSNKPKP